MLLWMSAYRSLCWCVFSFLWDPDSVVVPGVFPGPGPTLPGSRLVSCQPLGPLGMEKTVKSQFTGGVSMKFPRWVLHEVPRALPSLVHGHGPWGGSLGAGEGDKSRLGRPSPCRVGNTLSPAQTRYAAPGHTLTEQDPESFSHRSPSRGSLRPPENHSHPFRPPDLDTLWRKPLCPHQIRCRYSHLKVVVQSLFWPHGLQHAKLPCPSPSPGAYSNSCPLSQWCHPTILCCRPLLLPSIFPSIRVFSNKSALGIRWPKYWSFSFSISPSSEYSGLISTRIDWFDDSYLLQRAKVPGEAAPQNWQWYYRQSSYSLKPIRGSGLRVEFFKVL